MHRVIKSTVVDLWSLMVAILTIMIVILVIIIAMRSRLVVRIQVFLSEGQTELQFLRVVQELVAFIRMKFGAVRQTVVGALFIYF